MATVDEISEFALGSSPDALWSLLADTAAYSTWWSWLEASSLPALRRGEHAKVVLRPTLPFPLRIEVQLCEVEPARRIEAKIGGDLIGTALLDLSPSAERVGGGGGSTDARLTVVLDPKRPASRWARRILSPILRANHSAMLGRGLQEFAHATGVGTTSANEAPRQPMKPSAGATAIDVAVTAAVAATVSGVPSTLHALGTQRPLLEATRAAGALVGRPSVAGGLVAHTAVSTLWGAAIHAAVRQLAPSRPVLGAGLGALAGAAIAAVDLGVVTRKLFPQRLERIAALPTGAQVADHLVFGATAGFVAATRPHRRS